MIIELANLVSVLFLSLKMDLLLIKIQEMKIQQEDGKGTRKLLFNVIDEIRDYNDYVKELQYFLELTSFVQLSSGSFAVCIGLFTVITLSKFLGCAMVLHFIAQVALLCLNGAIATRQKDKILYEIYQFPWYKLSRESRKIFLMIIQMSQNVAVIKLPFFGVLDMEIFKRISQTAYSNFMFLYNFIK